MNRANESRPDEGAAPDDHKGTRSTVEDIALHERLLAAGIPVVVIAGGTRFPTGWATITVEQARLDIAEYRPGRDALAMVSGHGIDVLDVDSKAGADLSDVPADVTAVYGQTTTPSIGWHLPVPSTGYGQGVLAFAGKHVGDYCGGTADGAGRRLVFLPGSTRPKYPGGHYVESVQWDIDKLLDSPPDEVLCAYLDACGRGRAGTPAGAALGSQQVREFLAEHCEVVECRYGAKVLAGLIAEGSRATPGDQERGRHAWMVRASARVAELVLGGCLDAAAFNTLADHLDQIKPEGGTSAFSCFAWGIAQAKASEDRWNGFHDRERHGVAAPPQVRDGELKAIPLGREMAAAMIGTFLHVAGSGWHRWDGTRWERSETTDSQVFTWAADWAQHKIHDLIRSGAAGAVVREALRYREPNFVDALLRGALSHPALVVGLGEMDQHTHLLNCPNGVVDLRTGELAPSDPGLLFTKVCRVDYVADAVHPDWTTALEALPDHEMREFLKVRLGQAAYAEATPSDELLLGEGQGSNGKTAIFSTVAKALGDFAVTVPDSLLVTGAREHPTDLMTLRGARLALLEELPEDRRLNAARLKRIVGSGTITARLLYRDFVTFDETHTLVVLTNYRPSVNETDHGTWRRLLMLPFPFRYVPTAADVVTDSDRVADQKLKRRLLAGKGQQEAALAWVVAGAKRYAQMGSVLPDPPEAVRQATAQWREDVDPLAQYLDDRLVFDPAAVVSSRELLDDFNESSGRAAWGPETFTSRFRAHIAANGHHVEQARGYRGQVTDRRPLGNAGGVTALALPHRLRVWSGVRWRTAKDTPESHGTGGTPENKLPRREKPGESSFSAVPPVPPHDGEAQTPPHATAGTDYYDDADGPGETPQNPQTPHAERGIPKNLIPETAPPF